MKYDSLPKNIYSGAYRTGHCQGIAVDTEKRRIYYSFTTMLVKTDLEGNFLGSVTGLCGHLGCIVFNPGDGKVYGSLEYKNDAIGKGIVNMLGGGITVPDRFYMAIFDVDRIDRADMPSAEVMKCAFLREVTDDYLAEVTLPDGRTVKHRHGCSGIDGTAVGPDFGMPDGSQTHLFVSYGVYDDPSRPDNDYQVILKYSLDGLNANSAPLLQDDMHGIGPEKPESKYFVYTGNTCYGVQNLEYDPFTRKYFLCVYPGRKPEFRNPPLFAVDAETAPKKEILTGVCPETEGEILTLDECGTDGRDFPYGDTGFAALGEGYYYISHHGRSEEGQYTNVKLYRWNGDTFELA